MRAQANLYLTIFAEPESRRKRLYSNVLGSVIGKDNSTAPAAVASQPTPQTSQAQTDAPADVGREHFIEQQIEAEKRMVGEQDLLNDEHTPRSAN